MRDSAHAYCQEKLFPRVLEANRHERFDREIMNETVTLVLRTIKLMQPAPLLAFRRKPGPVSAVSTGFRR